MSVNHSGKEVGFIFASENTQPVADTSVVSGHTPGPWAWMGNQHGLYLATTHSGRKYVMGFRRMGMQQAQPVFRVRERLVPAADLVEFEVGDGTARGFAQGWANDSVYRYDVSGIDAADARLIAAAPDLLAACTALQMEARARGCGLRIADEAIAKATTGLEHGPSGYRGSDAPNLPTRET